jgi:hypothetical protein
VQVSAESKTLRAENVKLTKAVCKLRAQLAKATKAGKRKATPKKAPTHPCGLVDVFCVSLMPGGGGLPSLR